MRISEIIKEKRKALDMTQEKGTSLPDTALLPALARLIALL